MKTIPEFKTVPLAEISISATNPRKHFSEKDLAELATSIKEVGVIEPIIIRNTAKGYELVAGERRYRSSIIVGKNDIPCLVHNLSDDEAFEIQIIENLQRKDVHPLDEAVAFQKMLDTGRYSLQDICAKFAKPESFVVHRLKLNDLADVLKQDFFDGVMNYGHAALIARLPVPQQLELVAGYKNKGPIDGYGTVKQLEQEIKTEALDLDQAVFSRDIDFKCAQACAVCLKRTSVNPVLFADMQDADSCMDKSCYRQKTDEHIEEEVREIIDLGKDVILGYGHRSQPAEEIIALARKFNLKMLEEFDGFYTTERSSASQKAIFYVAGPWRGTHSKVWVPVPASTSTSTASSPAPAFAPGISDVQKLKDKERKYEELDQQKVSGTIYEALKKEFGKGTELPFQFDQRFTRAMFLYMAMSNSEMWPLLQSLNAYGYKLNFDGKSLDEVVDQLMALSYPQQEQLLALAMWKKFANTSTGSGIHAQIIRQLALSHPGIPVQKIEADQAAAAAERKTRLEEQIKKLEKPKTVKKHGQVVSVEEAGTTTFGVDFGVIRDVRDIDVIAEPVKSKKVK